LPAAFGRYVMAVTPNLALDRVLERIEVLPDQERPIGDALDHILSEEVHSPIQIPSFDNSAVDGYAVRASDIGVFQGLTVVGDVRAGDLCTCEVAQGTAVRVMTGAAIPTGADAVIPYERTRETSEPEDVPESAPMTTRIPGRVFIEDEVAAGVNIRRAGEDVAEGSRLFRPGQALGPSEIAVLAAIGRATVRVIPKPKVAVVATGDELVDPGTELPPGKVFNSNGYAIAALVARVGGDLSFCGIARDSAGELIARLEQVAEQSDLVVTTGGASRGVYDIVSKIGSSEWLVEPLAVRMRPGKQLVLGWLPFSARRPVPFIGLPGSPVAAMVGFELFVRPAIMRMRGLTDVEPAVVSAIAAEEFPNTMGVISFLRVRITVRAGQYYASSGGAGRSHGLRSLLGATGLAEIPADGGIGEGEPVRVRLTGWSGLPLQSAPPPDERRRLFTD
jgi:molybdopterin molybdotransferase